MIWDGEQDAREMSRNTQMNPVLRDEAIFLPCIFLDT